MYACLSLFTQFDLFKLETLINDIKTFCVAEAEFESKILSEKEEYVSIAFFLIFF